VPQPRCRARGAAHEVERERRIGRLQIGRRRHAATLQCTQRGNQLDGTAAAQQVAVNRLGRADRHSIAEHLVHRDCLCRIAGAGGGAMRVDVADVGCIEAGITQRGAHGTHLAARIGVGHVHAVAVGGVAAQEGGGLHAARQGVRFRFDHQRSSAFAECEADAVGRERTACSRRVVRRWLRGDAHRMPPSHRAGREHGLVAADDRDIDPAASYRAHRFAYSDSR